jgi:hypothetical protein
MKDNNKQTAVEWLMNNVYVDPDPRLIDKFNQAKAMEKEQIQEAWNNGAENWDAEMEGDDYYNETFGDSK